MRGNIEIVGFANMILQVGISASFLDFWTMPKSILEESEGMMISMKVVRNMEKNKNTYDTFPLAAIFGTPHISPP